MKLAQQVLMIHDFIANCGMARVFTYLISDKVNITDQSIFSDVSNMIKNALKKTFAANPGKTKLSQNSNRIA